MKKLLSCFIIVCLSIAMFSCTENSKADETVTEAGSLISVPTVDVSFGETKIILNYDDNVKDVYDKWSVKSEQIVSNSRDETKKVFDILQNDGWEVLNLTSYRIADFEIRTKLNNSQAVTYSVYFNDGLIVLTYDDLENAGEAKQKNLNADEIAAIKNLAYYYLTLHVE